MPQHVSSLGTLYHSGYPTKTMYACLFSPCVLKGHFDLNMTSSRASEEYRLLSSSLCNFPQYQDCFFLEYSTLSPRPVSLSACSPFSLPTCRAAAATSEIGLNPYLQLLPYKVL